MKHARSPASIHPPLAGYSHQIEVDGGRWLVLSGQVGMSVDRAVPEAASDQFALALDNVIANLDAAGMTAHDLVKLTFYLTEEIAPERRGAILAERLGADAPCMTLLYVAGLASPALKVEVDAWAVVT